MNDKKPLYKVEPPIVISDPIEFQINQNSTIAIPDSNDRVHITIGQIEGGLVITSLKCPVAPPKMKT